MALSKEEIEKITNENYDKIYKYCVSRCGNIDDASDITQEVFLLLLNKSTTLKNIKIKSWLVSVADKKIKEYFRQLKKEQSYISYDDCIDYIVVDIETEHEMVEDFEALLNDTQKRILSILSEQEKIIFIKRFVEKKSIKLVADELGTTEGNIRTHSSRIKSKGKKIISTTELLINVLFFKNFHIFL